MIRVVKMVFQQDKVEEFITIFASAQKKIAAFSGCGGVELMQDIENKNIFFTFSIWISTDSLEQYRKSDLFRETWAKTKPLFSQKAEAWSLEKKDPPHERN